MRRFAILIFLVASLIMPVGATEYTAPEPPQDAVELMPVQKESFGQGLWEIVKNAVGNLQPNFASACRTCLSLICVVLLVSVLNGISEKNKTVLSLAAALGVGGILIGSTNAFVDLGVQTVQQLSEYGKLLLPVLTASLAAQGGATTSAALYVGTMAFDTVLSAVVVKLLVPMIYAYIALSVANSALSEDVLGKIRDFIKWLMTWILKIALYVFTGFMAVTGVVSGTTDAMALKATKLTISGMVPMVGGILSDASEAVLVGAGLMKNAVGIYGLLAVLAIWISPFLQIGVQYLLLKITAAICEIFGVKKASLLIDNFSAAVGFLMAVTATICFMLFVSTICFMKGVTQ